MNPEFNKDISHDYIYSFLKMQNLLATDCQNLRLQHKKRTSTLVPVHFFCGAEKFRNKPHECVILWSLNLERFVT